MTLLDGGGTGSGGEVTTLSSRSVFHRNGSTNKKHIGNFNSDINANTTSNLTNNGIQRVPEIQTKTEDGGHDLKKWSDVCKMSHSGENTNGTNSTNGDSNNNHSSDGSVLPDMDFSN